MDSSFLNLRDQNNSGIKKAPRKYSLPPGAFLWILLENPFHKSPRGKRQFLGHLFASRTMTMPKYQKPPFASTTK
jgi:hypothetical protein